MVAFSSVWILGVRVDDVTYEEALEKISELVESGSPRHVITTNTEHAVAAQTNREFLGVLNRCALAAPDGSGLLLAARILGKRIRQHVTGTDLTEKLVALSSRRGWRVFFLGAAPGVADEAAAVLKRRYPSLIVAGTYAGSPKPRDEDLIHAELAKAGHIDVLLVAYGSPAQEMWIARNLSRMDVGVAVGVGGVFNFITGRVTRAPKWMRDLHLEWFYRLLREPWRWRRQLALPRFVLLVLVARLRGAVSGSGGASHPATSVGDDENRNR